MSALLREVAELLEDAGNLPCSLSVGFLDEDSTTVVLNVRIPSSYPPPAIPELQQAQDEHQLTALDLYYELRYLADVAQMRAFAARHDIPSDELEAVINKRRRERT